MRFQFAIGKKLAIGVSGFVSLFDQATGARLTTMTVGSGKKKVAPAVPPV